MPRVSNCRRRSRRHIQRQNFIILLLSARMKAFTLLALTGIFFLSGCAERLNIEGAKLVTQGAKQLDQLYVGDASYELLLMQIFMTDGLGLMSPLQEPLRG